MTLLSEKPVHDIGTMVTESGPSPVTHRWLGWMDRLARGRVTIYIIAIGVAVYGLLQRLSGMGRSLWLDEAWVANSVLASSLKGMFYYDAWLQSSPPLFLLMVRGVVSHLRPTNTAFRLIPLLMGILAILSMLALARRLLSRQFALLAWTLFVLSPVAVDYSKELKQYSAELAVSTTILLVCALYIENATVRRFWLLIGVFVIGLSVGYATVFILPGVILLVCLMPIRPYTASLGKSFTAGRLLRALVLAIAAGAVLLGEYFLLIKPNSPSALHASLARRRIDFSSIHLAAFNSYRLLREVPVNHLLRRQGLLLSLAGVIVVPGIVFAWLRFRKGRQKWLVLQIICLSPCILLIICDRFSWYPFTERSSLFALPFVVVLIVSSLQLTYLFMLQTRRTWVRPLLNGFILCATVLTINASHRRHLDIPREDMDGAVSFLRAHVQPADFLWIHSSGLEAFKFYTRTTGWQDPPAHYGHTGWPCCARGIDDPLGTFGEVLVRSDFGAALPMGFRGRVWLLYTLRPEHWLGKPNEPPFMRAILRERGCVEAPTPRFTNIGVLAFDCNAQAPVGP
jgi:hypothetical protein